MTNEELAKRAYKGEKEAVTLLYNQVSRILAGAAKLFYKRNSERCISAGVEECDLINESFFAMLDAVTAFNKSRSGYKFNTFLNYPLKNRFNALIGYRTEKGYNEPLNSYKSLEMPISQDDDELTLSDTIPDDKADFEDELLTDLTHSGMFKAVKEMLKDYPEEFEILKMKYINGMTHTEIGAKLSCEPQNILNTLKYTISILRKSYRKFYAFSDDDVICMSYSRSGQSYFNNSWNSSVEWAVNELMRSH